MSMHLTLLGVLSALGGPELPYRTRLVNYAAAVYWLIVGLRNV
jgi:hypothetical protein